MSGVKGRSGRTADYVRLAELAQQKIKLHLPAIMQIIIDKAIQGDKECAIYLVDRALGKPKQSIDARVNSHIQLTADDRALMIRVSSSDLLGLPVSSDVGSKDTDSPLVITETIQTADGKWDGQAGETGSDTTSPRENINT